MIGNQYYQSIYNKVIPYLDAFRRTGDRDVALFLLATGDRLRRTNDAFLLTAGDALFLRNGDAAFRRTGDREIFLLTGDRDTFLRTGGRGDFGGTLPPRTGDLGPFLGPAGDLCEIFRLYI